MYSMWLTEEQQQIWRGYLTMVSRLQTTMHRQLQQDCELSLSDYDVLVALSEWGPQRINELGEVLAWINTRIILGVVFYGVVTPLGLLMRLFSRDPMRRQFDRAGESYRIPRVPRPATHMLRQF